MAVLIRDAVDFIIFTEVDTISPLYRTAVDTLSLEEVYAHDQNNYSQIDNIAVGEANSYQLIRNRAVIDTITITTTYQRGVQDRSSIDILIPIESFDINDEWFHTSDTLVITETDSYTISTPVSDTLEITETDSYTIIRNVSVTDTLTLWEGYNGQSNDPYNPAYSIPNVTGTDPLIFKDGSLEFESRHYEFGNVEALEFMRVSRETRGGDVIVGPTTAVIETLDFTLLQMTDATCKELQSFIRATLGKEIEFKDHEGVWWNGVIMNPATPTTQSGRHRFTVAIQFEGVRQ